MTAIIKKETEKRAMSIAAMGLVNRVNDRFTVSIPSLRGSQISYQVWRDELGKIRCNCLEFEKMIHQDTNFRCEHILAVKFAVKQKKSEPSIKQSKKVATKAETESNESKFGEQKKNNTSDQGYVNGQTETVKTGESSLTDTKGEIKMNTENLTETTFNAEDENELSQNKNNVVPMNFASTLRNLHQNINPGLVKQRDGWKDRNGNIHKIDYVEWHTVADILDKNAPNWAHSVKDVRQIGNFITVTVAITIDGVTREGLGTGNGDSEMGIKKAEHDALKRAAVKFGIARQLYKKEADATEREDIQSQNNEVDFPANPVANSLMDLVTAKQLGMIRAISREIGIEGNEECQMILKCNTDELSKKAASYFIGHLQDLQRRQDVIIQNTLRKVG